MELSILDQVVTVLRQSRALVLIIPEEPSSDALAAALGLSLFLEKAGKTVRVVCPKLNFPPSHNFLPKSESIRQDLAALRDFVVSINIDKTKPDAVRYDLDNQRLHIYITPKSGFYEATDVTTSSGTYAYDATITLDVPSLNSLGKLYHDNAEFFYHVPIINIDHHSGNTRFGHINLIDIVASSVSEIVFELARSFNVELLDEHVATSLLTGIISKTKVFQSDAVTPRSLATASRLISAGARRDEIIRNLYQTKNIPTLQLWGRALARIQSTPDGKIVWSTVTAADLAATNARPAMAAGVLDELMINTPQAEYVALLVETKEAIEVFLQSQKPFTTVPPAPLHQESAQYAVGRLPLPLGAAERQLLTILRSS